MRSYIETYTHGFMACAFRVASLDFWGFGGGEQDAPES